MSLVNEFGITLKKGNAKCKPLEDVPGPSLRTVPADNDSIAHLLLRQRRGFPAGRDQTSYLTQTTLEKPPQRPWQILRVPITYVRSRNCHSNEAARANPCVWQN